MKFTLGQTRVYYRPAGPSTTELLFLAVFGAVLVWGLEHYRPSADAPLRRMALGAAERADRAFETLRQARLEKHIAIDPKLDPAGSGLIFSADTIISTSKGSLSSKQTSIHPDFAALLVKFWNDLGIQPHDHVAVGYTGSFPALNTALLAAAAEMDLDLVIVTSAASSDYGASDPRFTWLDMERVLRERARMPYQTGAASLGGIEDRALGLSSEARDVLTRAIQNSGAVFLNAKNYDESLRERVRFLESNEGNKPFKAYVNIGGGAVSLGRSRTKARLGPGIVEPKTSEATDSVAAYFLSRDIPVIHLGQVVELAKHYGIPLRPKTHPRPGSSRLFRSGPPHPAWTLLSIVAFLTLLIWVGKRARARAPLGPLPEDVLLEAAPSRHARPPSAAPAVTATEAASPAPGPPEEDTLHSLRPGSDR